MTLLRTRRSAYVARKEGSFIRLQVKRLEQMKVEGEKLPHHLSTKSPASLEYSLGNVGGGPCTIAVNWANTFEYVSGG